jgi:hypothetical protein
MRKILKNVFIEILICIVPLVFGIILWKRHKNNKVPAKNRTVDI